MKSLSIYLRSGKYFFILFKFFFAVILFSAILPSCKKEILIKETKEVTIADNKALPDQTIEDVVISNYVNRVYIMILGRVPTPTEDSIAYGSLRQSNLSMSSRMNFLNNVFANSEYLDHLYYSAHTELLPNFDTAEIAQQIFIYNFALMDTTYVLYYDIFKAEIVKLDSLRAIPKDLQNHTLDIVHMHSRCVNNYFYDDRNMGTENFVVSCFQHFLNRYPSVNELTQGKNIVDGVPGTLFLQSGQTKSDFIKIFFSSLNYNEGLVINAYRRFLLREPTSVEMGDATQKFKTTGNYDQMQKDILSTNEYIGIK